MNQQLIIDHLWLPTAVVRRHFRSADPDMIQEATVGMISAAERYQPSRGEFKAYAWQRALGSVKDYLGRERRKQGNWVPLEYNANLEAPPSDASLHVVTEALASLSARDQDIMREWMSGTSGREVADMFGVSQSRVSQIKRVLVCRVRALGSIGDEGSDC